MLLLCVDLCHSTVMRLLKKATFSYTTLLLLHIYLFHSAVICHVATVCLLISFKCHICLLMSRCCFLSTDFIRPKSNCCHVYLCHVAATFFHSSYFMNVVAVYLLVLLYCIVSTFVKVLMLIYLFPQRISPPIIYLHMSLSCDCSN